ncbi:hypothetical protein O6H91_Y414800 [Diphasiastrum complanatum]|nr:hypothetical protein O6H91_Y414800 [Diphasiastrum complanatum]
MLRDVENKEEIALSEHNEKLAIGFGIISIPPGTPICIKKNFRICDDCHKATKIISKVVIREIIPRYANRIAIHVGIIGGGKC